MFQKNKQKGQALTKKQQEPQKDTKSTKNNIITKKKKNTKNDQNIDNNNPNQDNNNMNTIGNTKLSHPERRPSSKTHPLPKSSILGSLFFCWLNEVIWVSKGNSWTQDMNYDLPPFDQVSSHKARILTAFKSTKSIVKGVFKAYPKQILFFVVMAVIVKCFNYSTTLAIKQALSIIVQNDDLKDSSILVNLILSFSYIALVKPLSTVILVFVRFKAMRLSVAVRSAVYSIIQDKIISSSLLNSDEFTEGYVTNLMQVDAYQLARMIPQIYMFINDGCSFFIGTIYMCVIVGWRLTLLILFIYFLLNTLFLGVYKMKAWVTKNYLKEKDKRMTLFNNLLANLEFIKINGLENFFCLKMFRKRENELLWLERNAFVMGLGSFVGTFAPSTTTLIFLILIAYVLPMENVTYSEFASIIGLFEQVKRSVGVAFSILPYFIRLNVNVERIDRFIGSKDIKASLITSGGVGDGRKELEGDEGLMMSQRGVMYQFENQLNSPSPKKLPSTGRGGGFEMSNRNGEEEVDSAGEGSDEVFNGSKNSPERRKRRFSTKRREKGKQPPALRIENGRFCWGEKNLEQLADGSAGGRTDSENDHNLSLLPERERAETQPSDAKKVLFYLNDINIDIKKGLKVGIIGSSSSGKSSLLYAFLGEMLDMNDDAGPSLIELDGSVSFLAQNRWILGDTVKENITLGKEFDEAWMERVLEDSQLKHDLRTFSRGLESQMGDNVDTVSGGQKARIALARCLYQE